MGGLTEGGSYFDSEGGLYIRDPIGVVDTTPSIIRIPPSPDGNDEGLKGVNGSGQKLVQENLLPENERTLEGPAFGVGPIQSGKPTLGR